MFDESLRSRVARLEQRLGIGRAANLLGVPQLPLAWEPGETPPEPPELATAAQLRVYNVLKEMDATIPASADAGTC